MKSFILSSFILLFSSVSVLAQLAITVKQAELSFASKAKDVNTKAAFLAFLDSSGVVFNKGRIINGLKAYQRAPEEGPRLLWTPAMSFMSKDEDLGYTTGPYEVRTQLSDSLLGCGQYSTVWKKNANGEWKILADLGVGYSSTAFPGQVLHAPTVNLIAADSSVNIQQLDIAFNQTIKANGIKAYDSKIAPYSTLNKEGNRPMQNKQEILQALAGLPEKTEFIPMAWGLAKSRDLAYVYGQMKNEDITENYMRIWGHTSKGWLLLLQVIKF